MHRRTKSWSKVSEMSVYSEKEKEGPYLVAPRMVEVVVRGKVGNYLDFEVVDFFLDLGHVIRIYDSGLVGGFVDDDVRKGELLQRALLDQTDFVGGDEDFEVLGNEAVCDGVRAIFLGAGQGYHVEIGCPSLELSCPVL